MLLRRPPPAVQALQGHKIGEVSSRLTPLADTRPMRIVKQVGPKAYVLGHPDTGNEELGFQQPVSLSRLIPFEMAQLETPVNATEELWIDIKSNKVGRDATWLVRRIIGQQASGNVRLQSADTKLTEVVDLASYEWRWRNPPRGEEQRRARAEAAAAAAASADPQIAIAKYDPVFADRNNPYAHPVAGDTAAWRLVLTKYLAGHARNQLAQVETLLEKYRGREKQYYDRLIATHEGTAKSSVPNSELSGSTCRVCKR